MRNQIASLACSNYPLEGIGGETGLEIWMDSEGSRSAMQELLQAWLKGRYGSEEGKERLGRVQIVVCQS